MRSRHCEKCVIPNEGDFLQDIYQIYLPIAGTSINVLVLISIGLCVGLLSGMFGIGGSVLCVPILVFIGIPTQVAIVTSANQMIASSFSSYIVYARRSLVDYKLSIVILFGSIIGAILGIFFFSVLSFLGQADLFVAIGLVLTLSVASFLSIKDAARIIYYRYKKISLPVSQISKLSEYLPVLQANFVSIQEKISLLLPVCIGIISGFVFSFVGVGGGIILLPMVLRILGIVPSYAVGTIQFQMIFVAIFTTILHTMTSQSLDIILSLALIVGSVFGTHIGVMIGVRLNKETFKILLGVLIMALCLKVSMTLFMTPKSLYYIEFLRQ